MTSVDWTKSSRRVSIVAMSAKHVVTTTINGRSEAFLCEARQTLLEVLRDVLNMTGTKEGCSNGNCGACTVLIEGRPVVSCLVLAVECQGANIETIEGIAEKDKLAPLQQAFLENAALQCGICTPGFILSATALLRERAKCATSCQSPLSEAEIRFHLAGNLCRCTGYDKIVKAVQQCAATK